MVTKKMGRMRRIRRHNRKEKFAEPAGHPPGSFGHKIFELARVADTGDNQSYSCPELSTGTSPFQPGAKITYKPNRIIIILLLRIPKVNEKHKAISSITDQPYSPLDEFMKA